MGLPAVAIAATVAATAISAYGYYQQGQASAAQASYQQGVAGLNAEMAKRNAELQERNARTTEAAGVSQADDRARALRQMTGTQRAIAAANGLDPDSGSAIDIRGDTERLGGLAIGEIRANAARQAYGYRIQGANAEAEASAASSRGQMYGDASGSAATAGWLSAGGSLLGGATRTFDRWESMSRTGVRMSDPPQIG